MILMQVMPRYVFGHKSFIELYAHLPAHYNEFYRNRIVFYFNLFSVLLIVYPTSNVFITKRRINLVKAMPALPINNGFETHNYSFYYRATTGFYFPI